MTGLGDAGPDLHGLAERAGRRVSGVPAADYVAQAIVDPGAHVVDGYANTMPAAAGANLSEEDLATLVAWLLAQ